jgi:hypothetical protein
VGSGKQAGAGAPQIDPQNLEKVIRETYLRTVSRPPTAAEVERAKGDVLASSSPVEGARELMWTLLNTREFLVNH